MLVKNFQLLSIIAAAIIASALFIATSIFVSYIETPLLPAAKSATPWQPIITSDANEGGGSKISFLDDTYTLSINFSLDNSKNPFPFAMATLQMGQGDNTSLFDWSSYSTITIRIKCQPHNTLTFALHTFDDAVSTLGNISSYRIATNFLTCTDKWQSVDIDLQHLQTPLWWLERKGLAFSNQYYDLSQLKSLSVTTSTQSPLSQDSTISINELTLKGQNTHYIIIAISLVTLFWVGFVFCIVRFQSQQLAAKLRTELKREASSTLEPQSINFESRQDKEKDDTLRFLAREYTNPELTMELLVAATGINRDKINMILKQESDLTFSTYLNQLRLQEAARLLQTKDSSVAEIAYAVGYKSVNYFNRLFKKAYDTTPKAYRKERNHK